MTADAPLGEQDPLWEKRWLFLASFVCIAIAVALMIATQPTHWYWPLFGWGLLVGLCGLAVVEGLGFLTLRREPPSPAVQARWKHRRLVNGVTWIFFGAVAGLVAAAFDWVWIDIILTAWALISLGAGGLVMVVVARRTSRTRPT